MRWRIIYVGPEECCPPRGQRLMWTTDSKICIMHLSMLILSWGVGGWVGGGGLGKGWGFDLKVLFWVKCPRDIVDHHIWWKENKFSTPPISVRLEVKGVWLKVATYQHSLFPKRYILLICWKNLENCELKPKFMHWTFQWADGWEKKNEHFETPK